MHWIDWAIIAVFVTLVMALAVRMNRYTRSVADFLAANRLAGRYLLTMAEGSAGLGAITMVAHFEKFYKAGFAAAWWGTIFEPITLIVALSGWVIYRYRQTRAMTFPQFFEMRYSRRFRVFAGMLVWVAGLLNYGIFPAVTARFLIYLCGIPIHTVTVGPIELNLTLAAVMIVLLSLAVTLTLSGGQIAVMVTDFVQGMFFNIAFLAITLFLVTRFDWSSIIDTLKQAPPGRSMLNPFDQSKVEDFDVWFFLISGFMMVYAYRAWLNNNAYRSAARSPHEAKMAGILAGWRGIVTYLMMLFVPICMYVLMHSPDYASQAAAVHDQLNAVADPQLREQLTVPTALTHVLPIGLLGLFAAAAVGASLTTDDTALHSWGSIFIQDVVMPLRGKPLSPAQHMRWLRWSIVGVAAFAFTFSLIFPLREYILMFLHITTGIYTAGAGSVILGGLYWKRGNTTGAWAALITGSSLALTGVLLKNVIWPFVLPALLASAADSSWLHDLPAKFPLNGVQMTFIAAACAIVAYISGSLLSADPHFDMDRMLHRGKYALPDERKEYHTSKFWKRLGMGPEFTRGDKAIYLLKLGWASFWFATFLAGTIYGLFFPISNDAWATWWLFRLSVVGVACVLTTIWFTWGGLRDLAQLMRQLTSIHRDTTDDGTVREDYHLSNKDPQSRS